MLLSSSVYRQVSSRVSSYWTWGQRQGGRSILPRARAAQPRSLRRSLPGPPRPRARPDRGIPGTPWEPGAAGRGSLPAARGAEPGNGRGERSTGTVVFPFGSPGPGGEAPRPGEASPGSGPARGIPRGAPARHRLGIPGRGGVAAEGETPGCTGEALPGRGDRDTVPRTGGCARARSRRGRAGDPSRDPGRRGEGTGRAQPGRQRVRARSPSGRRPLLSRAARPAGRGLRASPGGRAPALPRSAPPAPGVPQQPCPQRGRCSPGRPSFPSAAVPAARLLPAVPRCRAAPRGPHLPPPQRHRRPPAAPCRPPQSARRAAPHGQGRPGAAALFLKVLCERKGLKGQSNLLNKKPPDASC